MTNRATVTRAVKWSCGLIIGSLTSTLSLAQLDPTDDFSFSLHHGQHPHSYSLISEQRISALLSDRLDLFPKSESPRLAAHLMTLCQHHRFDPAFILSLIEIESSFRVKAVSPVGAIGLMQVMPPTAKFILQTGRVRFSGHEHFKPKKVKPVRVTAKYLSDPYFNMAVGIAYLAWLRDHYKGTPYHILAAYNVGPTRLDQLLARKRFRPVETKRYFQKIRRRVPHLRHYQPRVTLPKPV